MVGQCSARKTRNANLLSVTAAQAELEDLGMLCIQLASKILFHCGIHIKKKLTNLLLVQSLS